MNSAFQRKQNLLFCENVSLSKIAETVLTPCYVYSRAKIIDNLRFFRSAVEENNPTLICYALKANSNLSILKLFSEQNCGAECVSGGEIKRALLSEVPARNIIFDGVGKTTQELQYAMDLQVKQINAESRSEVEELNGLAANAKTRANVGLRVNTDTDAHTHRHLTTGRHCDKFGMSVTEVKNLCEEWQTKFPNLNFAGFTIHLGSQISTLDPYRTAYGILKELVRHVHEFTNLTVRTLDLGGGVGIDYKDGSDNLPISLPNYGNLVKEMFADMEELELLFEPGRCLVGNAGCLLATVVRTKEIPGGTLCAIIDAGMNDLVRPALYGAHHEIVPVFKPEIIEQDLHRSYQIVGPICESADIFLEKASFPGPLQPGDVLAIMDCGAYGFSMASRYNSRLLPAEVIVEGENWKIIGKRESLDDALIREIV